MQYAPAPLASKEILASAYDDGAVVVYDVKRQGRIASFVGAKAGHSQAAACVAFSPVNAHLLASAGRDAKALFYDIRRGTVIFAAKGGASSSPLSAVAFLGDGVAFVVGNSIGSLQRFDLRKPAEPVATALAHPGFEVASIAVHLPRTTGSAPKKTQPAKKPRAAANQHKLRPPAVAADNNNNNNSGADLPHEGRRAAPEAAAAADDRAMTAAAPRTETSRSVARSPWPTTRGEENGGGRNAANAATAAGSFTRRPSQQQHAATGTARRVQEHSRAPPEAASDGQELRQFVREALDDVRSEVRNLHVDMVKHFQLQLLEMKALLAENVAKFTVVAKENDRLKQDNARLRGLL